MTTRRVLVVGGGAAGFFAAITCAQACPTAEVWILEQGSRCLDKVRISGGGRCNVTHTPLELREFASRYPRGGQALLSPLHQFSASDTVAWFNAKGIPLKTESDGRVFPQSDSSQSIVECLKSTALAAGVNVRLNTKVAQVRRSAGGGFEVMLAPVVREQREFMTCDKILLATGGCRAESSGNLAVSLGHTLEAPVPSLFAFHVTLPWLRELAGVSADVEASIGPPQIRLARSAHGGAATPQLRERGPILITHAGFSGPVILRLSAWGARLLHSLNYEFTLRVNWLPQHKTEQIAAEFQMRRQSQPARLIVNTTYPPLPQRLWEKLALAAVISRETRWSGLSRAAQHQLTTQLVRSEFIVSGKTLNREEFVTCGGVRLDEVNFRTMESRICPGLYFAGELLDLDGLTGGFNLQAAWTTGFIAGQALAGCD